MYSIETQNRETKEWETFETACVDKEGHKVTPQSRRQFLLHFDRKRVIKRQWRCRKVA